MSRKRRKRVDPRLARARTIPENPGWKWRTLPVWLALTGGFIIGYYVALAGTGVAPESWAFWTLMAVVAAFSFGLSRITAWFAGRWTIRRRAKSAAVADRPVRPSKGPQAPGGV